MGILEDVMKAIERIPGWKRIVSAPDEIDELKKRIEELEAKLAPATGVQCPICREPHFKVISSRNHPKRPHDGVMLDRYQCDKCGNTEELQRK